MGQIVRMIVKSSVDKVTRMRYSAAYPTGAERCLEKWVSDGVVGTGFMVELDDRFSEEAVSA